MFFTFIGWLIIAVFIMYLIHLMKIGPYIRKIGTKYFIDIKNLQFSLNDVTIGVGDSIEFINYEENVRHVICIDDPMFVNSNLLLQYDSIRYTFTSPGTFTFYSSLYKDKGMDDCIIRVMSKRL